MDPRPALIGDGIFLKDGLLRKGAVMCFVLPMDIA